MSDENQEQEQTTTIDSIDASLRDLIKAADATETVEKLQKSYGGGDGNITGNNRGGRAGKKETGGMDDMMYGKLSAAGFSDAQIGVMAELGIGKMTGRAEGEDPEEEDDDDEDDDKDEMEGNATGKIVSPTDYDGKMKKSFTEQFAADQDIAGMVDVAPFLEALTARTTKALDGLQGDLMKSERRARKMDRATAAVLYDMSMLVKSQSRVISELGRRLGVVEKQPLPARGATSTPMAKSMKNEIPGGVPGSAPQPINFEKLTKSQVASALSYMNLEKGMKQIDGRATWEMASMVESGGQVPRTVLNAVQGFLASNPAEANLALAYT